MAKRTDSRKRAKHNRAQTKPINGETLRDAVNSVVGEGVFANLKFHGNTTWTPACLVTLAVVWVWSDAPQLTAAFTEAHRWSTQVLGHAAVSTYQGLMKALVAWTADLLPLLWRCLHESMETHAGEHWRVGLWLPIAVDGSRISVPRSRDNEKAFCAPGYGHGKTAKYRKSKSKGKRSRRKPKEQMQPVKPQIWVTLCWHMSLQMPWSWATGPSNSSERDHFRKMLATQKFPTNTLFCGDAGFVGYEFWKDIIDAGQSFLIRVGANVRLLRRLGYVRERGDCVYFWPDHAARRLQPPLVLRLLRLKVGRCEMHLLTNVVEEDRLTTREAIEMYQLRWGIELEFRTLKQTFGRRKLRSRTPNRALVELDWSLLGLWIIQLFAVKEQIKLGEVPKHCSASLAIQVVRATIRRWSECPDHDLWEQLQAAQKDTYLRVRSKQGRYQSNYKDKPKAGRPMVTHATERHKLLLQKYLKAAA